MGWQDSFDQFWLVNGALFYVLLFTTDEWQRLVPTSWEVFPNALSTQPQCLPLHFPADDGWLRYNSLQQLAYFVTVFIAAPLAVFTGLMLGPAIGNKLGWSGRTFHRQLARDLVALVKAEAARKGLDMTGASTRRRRSGRVADVEFVTEERRFELVTVWISATDLRRALGCSRSLAYEHLRPAANRGPGVRGLMGTGCSRSRSRGRAHGDPE